MVHGVAMGCRKVILVFNTNPNASDSIHVIQPEEFGGKRDTDIPVVIAYNQSHYESLHPLDEVDIEKTMQLVQSYITGNYQFSRKDIPFLTTKPSVQSLKENSEDNIIGKLEQLRSIRMKDRTVDQQREFRRLSMILKRKNMSTDEKEKIKENDKEAKRLKKM